MRVRFLRAMLASVLLASMSAPATTVSASPSAAGAVYLKAAGFGEAPIAISDSATSPDAPQATIAPQAVAPQATITPQATGVADAIPIPPSPAAGTLAAQGASTLYSIPAVGGSRIELSLTGIGGVFDAYLFAPGLGALAGTEAVAHSCMGGYPRTLTYDVPPELGGTYYVEIYAYQGSGSYTLTWAVRDPSERARIDVGSATPITLPYTAGITIPDQLQANKLYRFYAASSRRIQVDLSGPVGADFDLYLYAPGTGSILPSSVEPLVSANEKTATERLIYDVPLSGFGTFYLEVLRFSGSGAATVQITSAVVPPAPITTRVSGPDRYSTATMISHTAYPAGSSSVVLCSGLSFPDGLAASSLAGALNAPILLTGSTTLPNTVGLEMQRLGVTTVYVVGGVAAIGFPIEQQISNWVPGVMIKRVSGGSRYETAGEVADMVHEITGTRPNMAFIACGETFPDALALSPIAYATKTPILLVGKTVLPEATAAALSRLRGGSSNTIDLVIAGGEGAVGANVAHAATLAAGGTQERYAGTTRYETALAIAEMAVFAGWADPSSVAVASGVTFPDALGGAPLPGRRAGVLVLSPGTDLGVHSTYYLKSFNFAVEQAWVLGGTMALPQSVVTAIDAILPDQAHDYTW